MATTQPGVNPNAPEVQRWRPLVAKYFPPAEVDNALKVIAFESGGNPGVPSSIWGESERSVGLFQINTNDNAHPQMRQRAYDPEANVAYSASLWQQNGWANDWTAAARYYGLDGTGQGGSMAEPDDGLGNYERDVTSGAGGSIPAPSTSISTYGPGGEVGYTGSQNYAATNTVGGEVADYAIQIGRYEQDIATSQQQQVGLRERQNKAWLAGNEAGSLREQLKLATANKNQAEIARLTPLIAEQEKIAADWTSARDALNAEIDREKQLQKSLSDARSKYAQAVAKSGEAVAEREWKAAQDATQNLWQSEENARNRTAQENLARLNQQLRSGDITLQQAQQAFTEEIGRAQLALQQRQQAISGLTGANQLSLQGSQWALPKGSTAFPGYEVTGPLAKVAKQIGVRYTPPVPSLIRFDPRQDVIDALAGKYGGGIPAPGGAGAGVPGSTEGTKPSTGQQQQATPNVGGALPTGQGQAPTYGPNGQVGYTGSPVPGAPMSPFDQTGSWPQPTIPTYGPNGEVGYIPPPTLSPADRARLIRTLPAPPTGMF